MNNNPIYSKLTLTGGALVLAVTASVYADGTNPPPAATSSGTPAAAPGTLNSFFNGKLPDAIGKGKITLNSRLRWEHADQSNLQESDAFTLRTRFGLTTASLYGFLGMIEGENVTSLGDEDDYNAAGSNPPGAGKTVIADPPTTEINQAWLSYTYTNRVTLKGGRERIVLDNARFVGDVGWRQNQQTFDAVSVQGSPVKDLNLFYGYIWDVHRVFGNVGGLAQTAATRDFDSSSHLLNASYSGWKYGKVTVYSYLLDLSNGAGSANSCATYGASIAGTVPAGEKIKLNYHGEFAWQTDYANSPLDYGAEYYRVELGATVKPLVVGAGYEVLGSDDNKGPGGGLASFRTPLATLHAFNGWADVFLTTPAAGLHDLYAFAQVTVPKIELPIRFVYHKFDADKGSGDYGQEFDLVAVKKFGKHWSAIAKYACYDGHDSPYSFDVDKFWLETDFNY